MCPGNLRSGPVSYAVRTSPPRGPIGAVARSAQSFGSFLVVILTCARERDGGRVAGGGTVAGAGDRAQARGRRSRPARASWGYGGGRLQVRPCISRQLECST